MCSPLSDRVVPAYTQMRMIIILMMNKNFSNCKHICSSARIKDFPPSSITITVLQTPPAALADLWHWHAAHSLPWPWMCHHRPHRVPRAAPRPGPGCRCMIPANRKPARVRFPQPALRPVRPASCWIGVEPPLRLAVPLDVAGEISLAQLTSARAALFRSRVRPAATRLAQALPPGDRGAGDMEGHCPILACRMRPSRRLLYRWIQVIPVAFRRSPWQPSMVRWAPGGKSLACGYQLHRSA